VALGDRLELFRAQDGAEVRAAEDVEPILLFTA
jgi:hypothetical protein